MVTADTDLSDLLSWSSPPARTSRSHHLSLTNDGHCEERHRGGHRGPEEGERGASWQEGIRATSPSWDLCNNWSTPRPHPASRGARGPHRGIRHGSTPTCPETKMPPAPSIQTPVTPSASSPSHSRTSSSTSALTASHSRTHSENPPMATQAEKKAAVSANGAPPLPFQSAKNLLHKNLYDKTHRPQPTPPSTPSGCAQPT
ncbi:hypothetical protein GWK47_053039 [Chionoecetes opilio]|uniref:Uncharacterized protein n=1 Tax=Chionoecetes opilio TaxID=41210 RepID=A0A8J5CPT4_CHIOP|nr:hypothetical protein GWK47_053039 [Chionoecetes opilio]